MTLVPSGGMMTPVGTEVLVSLSIVFAFLLGAGVLFFVQTVQGSEARIVRAQRQFAAGRFDRARDVALRVVQKNPLSASARFLLARSYQALGEIELAAVEHQAVLGCPIDEEDVHEADVLGALAHLYRRLDRREKEKEVLLLLQRIEGENPRHSLNLGEIYLERGEYARAVGYLLRAAERAPTMPETYRLLGRGYIAMGKFQDAIFHLSKALFLRKEDGEARFLLGRALLETGNPEKAAESLRIACKDPGYGKPARRLFGKALAQLGKHAEALEELSRAWHERGEESGRETLFLLGECNAKLRNAGRALSAWKKLSAIDDRFPGLRERLQAYGPVETSARYRRFMELGDSGAAAFFAPCLGKAEFNLAAVASRGASILLQATGAPSGKTVLWLFFLSREIHPLSVKEIDALVEEARALEAGGVLVFNTLPPEKDATEFAASRTVFLFSRDDLTAFLEGRWAFPR